MTNLPLSPDMVAHLDQAFAAGREDHDEDVALVAKALRTHDLHTVSIIVTTMLDEVEPDHLRARLAMALIGAGQRKLDEERAGGAS